VRLGQQTLPDRALVGGKAANLSQMLRAGLPVPGGFCITTAAFRNWLDGNSRAAALLAQLAADAPASSASFNPSIAAAVREALAASPLPGTLRRALEVELARAQCAIAWAVRSSAPGEDSAAASFAGQHDSVLDVRGAEAVADAVRRCWVSLFSDRAIAYRLKRGIPPTAAAMGVVVQEFVPAEAAGVMFTADPVTGDTTRLIIEATAGLGEALVSGRVSPQHVVLDKPHSSEQLAASKSTAVPGETPRSDTRGLAPGAAGAGDLAAPGDGRAPETGQDGYEVPGGRPLISRTQPSGACLSMATARRLADLGCQVERLFGCPQDIEWAVCDGQVFLLQSRPITALPSREGRPKAESERFVPIPILPRTPSQPANREADEEVWTNANVTEALPDVVTPMAWSVWQRVFGDFLYPLMRRLGLHPDRRPMAALIAGRAYLGVRALQDLVQPFGLTLPGDVTTYFGGMQGDLSLPLTTSVRPATPRAPLLRWSLLQPKRLLRLGKQAAWLLPGLIGQRRLIRRWGERVIASGARTPPARLSDEQLADYPFALLRLAAKGEGQRTWAAGAWMGIAAVGGTAALFTLARRWLGDDGHGLANRLLAGAEGMNSAENGLELARLAAWARPDSALKAALLAPGGFSTLEPKLAALPRGPEFLVRWSTFMDRHGHQARGGMDIFQPRWSEMPDFVLEMLRVYLEQDEASNPLAAQARRRMERAALLADLCRRLRNPLKRWLLLLTARLARRGLVQRENVKNDGVRLIALLRRAAFETGDRLVARGQLRERGEVFFLRIEELRPALCGDPGFDVAATVAPRKTEFARHRLLHPPPVIVGCFQPDAAESALEDSRRGPPAGAQVRLDATKPHSSFGVCHSRFLKGVPVSPGCVTGRARVILQADAAEPVRPGEILVAPYTDPGWTPYFLAAAGIVVDVGGLLSHGSVVAREYGLPAVVNVGQGTTLIKTGQLIRVDGDRGAVTILD
jgi:pyruvate,water dikinase